MTALGLPHGWELVNQVGVVALFAGRSSQWASYFEVPVVLLTMSFRAYAQVLPTVKRIRIIPRSESTTEAKKNLGRNFTQRAQESALIPDVRTLQQIINQNTRYSNRTQNYFYINRVVLLAMSFRAYAQVLPTVKRIGIIPRSEPAIKAKKKIWAKISPNEPKKVL